MAGAAGWQDGPGPARWMLWMTSPGLAHLTQGDLPPVVGGEDGPMHLRGAAAAMTCTTKTRQETYAVGTPTMMTSDLETAHMLMLGPTTTGLGTPVTMVTDPGTPNMMGG